MSIHRRTPLPLAPAMGRLLVAEQVLAPTLAALRASRGPDGPHEGLVLWLGRTTGSTSIVLSMIRPITRTGPDFVLIDERAVAATSRAARDAGLGVIAQVHSHPGVDTRHSDGDDQLVLMPFAGMFSLVVARYGAGSLDPSEGGGLHQFQDGRWIQVADPKAYTVVAPMSEIPAATEVGEG
jgi:proteasome lid subunit RPN8/RPN11